MSSSDPWQRSRSPCGGGLHSGQCLASEGLSTAVQSISSRPAREPDVWQAAGSSREGERYIQGTVSEERHRDMGCLGLLREQKVQSGGRAGEKAEVVDSTAQKGLCVPNGESGPVSRQWGVTGPDLHVERW